MAGSYVGGGTTSEGPKPEEEAQMIAYAKKIWAVIERGKLMDAQGDYVGAKKLLETNLLSDPQPGYAAVLADIEVANEDYVNAYKLTAPFVRNGTGTGPEDILLRASLAAASLGDVYPGQREYCVGRMGSAEEIKTSPFIAALPQGNSPDVVAAISHIAIAGEAAAQGNYRHATHHYEAALRFDPGNPAICLGLGYCYAMGSYNYTRAIETLKSGLARSEKLRIVKQALQYEIRQYETFRKLAGDGHRGWDVPVTKPPSSIRP
jgi:tetratricopeptide (TPR) repeat protein